MALQEASLSDLQCFQKGKIRAQQDKGYLTGIIELFGYCKGGTS